LIPLTARGGADLFALVGALTWVNDQPALAAGPTIFSI
jgi:hypothetical protein